MVIFQAINAIFSLDINFFINIFMGNLLWVFIFYVMVYFFLDGKQTIKYFIIWGFLIWAIITWEELSGMAFSVASFLLLFYLSKLTLLKFIEDSPVFKKYIVLISTVQAYAMIFFFNYFMR